MESLATPYPNASLSPAPMRVLFLVVLLVPLAACQPGDSVGPQPDSFFALKDSSITHAPWAALADGDSLAWQELGRVQFLEGVIPAMQATREAVDGSSSWREMDAALRRFLEDAHPNPAIQSRREATAASGFLPGHLINADELTPEKQQAIAYYTTLVIENQSFQGIPQLGPALDRLEGYWPEAKIAEARQLVEAATLHAENLRTPSR